VAFAWMGVILGKTALVLIFWKAGMVVAGRDAWFLAHWQMMQVNQPPNCPDTTHP